MAESSSLCPPEPQAAESRSKLGVCGGERRAFVLTEAQRIYIQHHLPKAFFLLPVASHCSRLSSDSKTLIEDSRAFFERKRGRPEGSSRKHLNAKTARERKSARIASVARPSYAALQDKFGPSSPSSSLDEQPGEIPSEKEEAEEAQPAEASIEEGLRKGGAGDKEQCKASENQNLSRQAQKEDQVNKQDQPSPLLKLQVVETKQAPKKLSRNKSSKKSSPPSEGVLEGEFLQTPTQKEELQDFAKELKTEPSRKDFSTEMQRFEAERAILRRLKTHREILPFLEPVDEARDGAPNYYREIASPIDLQTIEFKLSTGIYKTAEDFHADVRLMWANSKSYNRRNAFMQQATEELERFYLHLLTRPQRGRKKRA